MQTAQSLAALSAVFVASTSASANFTILGSVDASDNPAVAGANITTDGTFFQSSVGTSNPPASIFIAVFPELEYDSYIALDGANANGQAAPSSITYTPNAATTALPTVFTGSSLEINSAFSMPGTGIAAVQQGDGRFRVFFARLTVVGGSGGISAPSVVVNVADGGGGLDALDITVGMQNAVPGPQGLIFWIDVLQTPSAFGTVNDLYITALPIPGPSGAGLAGLLALPALRRPRRPDLMPSGRALA